MSKDIRTVEFWKHVTYKGNSYTVDVKSSIDSDEIEVVTIRVHDSSVAEHVYTYETKFLNYEDKNKYIDAVEWAIEEYLQRSKESAPMLEFENWDGNFDTPSVSIGEHGITIKGGSVTVQASNIKQAEELSEKIDLSKYKWASTSGGLDNKVGLGQINITINGAKVGELDLTKTILEELEKRGVKF